MTQEENGRRFSHTYLVRGEPVIDSKKARFRIAKLAEKSCPPSLTTRHGRTIDHNRNSQDLIEEELGIKFATRSKEGNLIRNWEWYFSRITVIEMLDTITIISKYLRGEYNHSSKAELFLREVQRILIEENLAYKIDSFGGVHPLIDATFSAAMESAISILNEPRYSVSAECISKIDGYLLNEPQDYISAIRAAFGACENTFKLMYAVPRLDSRTAGDHIGRDQQAQYSNHPALQAASAKALEGFKQWINAAHFYRHEQGVEEPSQPEPELAILLISQGLSFSRWLVSIDKKITKS